MIIHTTRFGELDFSDEDIYVFQEGVPGFEQDRKFVLVEVEDHEPFSYLQSVHSPELALIVVDPFEFFPTYEFDLPDNVLKELEVKDQNQLMIKVVVNAAGGLKSSTANLIAPIIFNVGLKCGQQVILTKGDYSTRHLLFKQQVER